MKKEQEQTVASLNARLAESQKAEADARQAAALAQQSLDSTNAEWKRRLDEANKNAADKLMQEREHSREMRDSLEKQQEERLKLMREELQSLAARMLDDSRQSLTKENRQRLDELLSPLRDRLDNFNRTVTDNTKENAANKTEMKTAFEDAMKKLHDEQEMTVRSLRDNSERTVKALQEQTERIAGDAASLTQALKGDSKMQGDWGEMILEKTLDDCGLVKDQQYFLQENFKDEEGNNFRPDAVIVFPNDEKAVVDSKVSLTAYHEAVKTDDAEQRDQLLREHVVSVRKHVDELSAKNYEKIVPGCIGFVLMFIPYESGYSAAVKTDPAILHYAYRKHIIILSPSNLLMALQLTHTMWQNYRLNANVEEILRQSNDLYDKFCTFAETFVKIEDDIRRLQTDYDKSKNQLRDGKGNIIRRLEGMKQLGISPKKEIPEKLN